MIVPIEMSRALNRRSNVMKKVQKIKYLLKVYIASARFIADAEEATPRKVKQRSRRGAGVNRMEKLTCVFFCVQYKSRVLISRKHVRKIWRVINVKSISLKSNMSGIAAINNRYRRWNFLFVLESVSIL